MEGFSTSNPSRYGGGMLPLFNATWHFRVYEGSLHVKLYTYESNVGVCRP